MTAMADQTQSLMHWAIRSADIGFAVLPLRPSAKTPLFDEWQNRATTERAMVRQWWTRQPRANIGAHCGKSGLVVIDVDPRNGGDMTLARLQEAHGPLWETGCIEAYTAGGGRHFVFRAPEGVELPQSLGPGIDVLHGNRYFVLAPSIGPMGNAYRWAPGQGPHDPGMLDGLPELPQWIRGTLDTPVSTTIDALAEIPWQPVADTPAELARLLEALHHVDPDCDNDTYHVVNSAVLSTGWTRAREILNDWASGAMHGRVATKYKARDHHNRTKKLTVDGGITLGSLYALAAKQGFNTSRTPPAAQLDTYGDISNGQRFAAKFRGLFLYVHAAGKWMRYDGMRWAWCDAGEALKGARTVAADALDDAHAALRADPTERAKSNHAHALGVHRNVRRLEAMLTIAATEDGMSIANPAMLDADPWLLSVRNGMVNLRTGTLLASDPTMLISRQAGASFNRDALCPQWLDFLAAVFTGNAEVIEFVQRAVGYSLTGLVDEEMLFFLLGSGANGKSVFANIVQAIFGEYAVTVRATLLARDVKGNTGDAEREKARLPGARLALVNEVGLNDAWDDQRMKEIVSRERVSARLLYGESFEFMPSHTIWVRGNHQPAAMDSGDGFWRRIALLRFSRQFTEAERVADLDRRILEAERDGILGWMVEGCLAWQRDGLRIPTSIKADSDAYRRDSDQMGEWLDTHCQRDPHAETPVASLFSSYCEFLRSGGMRAPSKPAFSRQLTQRGFAGGRTKSARTIYGLILSELEGWATGSADN